jgi:hypothetical protein
MEAEGLFNKLVSIYQTAGPIIPRDRNVNTHNREKHVPKVQDGIESH